MSKVVFDDIINNKLNDYQKINVTVGCGTCGIARGADKIFSKLKDAIKSKKIENVILKKVGCIGICSLEPIVELYIDNKRYTYVNVKLEDVDRLIDEHITKGEMLKDLIIDEKHPSILDSNFLKKQKRIALRNCGNIDPEDIDDYIANEGYSALEDVLEDISREKVISIIKKSGLRGRGGAGFKTGDKWELTYMSKGKEKYVCCNADEGDPGAFMDRSILEGDPHSVIEAMIIAGYVIGANKGYIYVRAEYPLAVSRLETAIKKAKEYGFLGKNILGSNFNFDLSLRLGAGAFVCGEETALMTSIEGNRGEPRPRPPFPSEEGLFGKPTLLNNVETYANIAPIILNGSTWFNSIGTEKSSGTKVFALAGKVINTGLVEIPIGTSLKTIIYDIGGGIPNGKKFKVAQTGGPSGGCIPNKFIDIAMDYEPLTEIGTMMGSGGLIVMDEDTCMVDIAKYFLEFTTDESCGKCTPCRIGTKRLYEIIENISNGKATIEDLDKLEELCNYIKDTSLCGLGQSAPNPVLSTLKYFKEEYIEHIKDKTCKTFNCKGLYSYVVDSKKCIGCNLCRRNCPADAITGGIKIPHTIDNNKCVKCGLCMENCKFDAIYKK